MLLYRNMDKNTASVDIGYNPPLAVVSNIVAIYRHKHYISSFKSGCSSKISFSPLLTDINGIPTLPCFLISSNSGLLSLNLRYNFRLNILSVISTKAYFILFSERNSFSGSQSGQYLLPKTTNFFIVIPP